MVFAHDSAVIKKILAGLLGFIFLFLFSSSAEAVNFTISNPEILGNDEIFIQVDISDLGSTSCTDNKCYLQSVFAKPGTNDYFGQTLNTYGDWYKYFGEPEVPTILSTFFYFTPIDNNWSGKLKVKNDSANPNYKGPGDYVLKVRRFTGKSVSYAQESNDLPVTLSYVIPVTETATSTPTSTPTPTPTPTPTKKVTSTATVVAQETSAQENTILGLRNDLTTDAPTAGVSGETAEGKKLPPMAIILIAVGTLVLGGSGFAFIKKVREDKRSPNEQDPPVS